jgi:signal transduction histidine kinase
MHHILIVDDEPTQLQSLKIGLSAKGYTVGEALNVRAALEYLENASQDIDLILADYLMPGLNGFELFERVKSLDPDVSLIMMTAYGKKELVMKALRSGCDGFIEKPFTMQELSEEIRRVETMKSEQYKNGLAHEIPHLVHQIKNPLTMIMGSAELILMDGKNPEIVKSRMASILESVQSIQEINQEMLHNGKNRQEQTELLDIRVCLQDCLRMFEDMKILKGIHSAEDLGESPVYIQGNRFGLEQVFRNLILNALEAMEDSPQKHLTLTLEKNASVSIHVQDTGPGISEDKRQTIFTPYYTSKKQGTGLGLSLVKDIVKKHGGSIAVHSCEGHGAVFTVRLPQALEDPGSE